MKQILIAAIVILTVSTGANAQTWKLNGNTLTGTELLGSRNAFDLKLYTNSLQRMTIKADGKIGFGTTNPLAKYNFYGLTRIDDSLGSSLLPLLILNGRSNNATIELRTNDTLKTIFGYDQSGNSFNINVTSPYISSFAVNRGTGNVQIGNQFTPAAQIDILNSTKISSDLTVAGTNGLGDMFFTYYQQGIRFPTFGATGENSAMIYMTDQTTANARMVLAHSKAFSNWGLQYDDATDQFNYLGNGSNKMAINLSNGRVGIGNATPSYILDITGTSRFSGNMGIQTAPNTRTLQIGSTLGALVGIGTAEYIQDAGTSSLSTAASWLPVTDNIYSLGNSTYRWQDVWAVDGTINTSDARDKTNIRDMNYGLKEIMKLRSVKYAWKNNPDEGDKLGVIAQEIQKVLPEVVRDWQYSVDETTGKKTKVPSAKLGVMYADIIPVLIRGMQEQQQQIEQMQQVIDKLSQSQSATDGGAINSIAISNTRLEQNTPNPFNKATTIRYNIPAGFKTAQLIITDNTGKTLKQMQLTTAGAGTVNIDGSMLSSGMYQYSLIIDGKTADTKKMLLTK